MRLIAKAFIISLSLFSGATFAADSNGETFAKNISSATSWNSLLGNFNSSLNPLVAKELAKITHDLPFPAMTVHKGKLSISNENGEHMTVMFFKKNGAVTLNGKEWTNRPLATPEAEVNRIVEVLNGGASVSFLDFVMPPAFAAGLGMSKSVAAAAYASSMAWKGEACKQEDTSDELNASCMLMAVAMRSPTPINPNIPVGPNSYYATDLACPPKAGGKMIHVMKNKAGWTVLINAEFKGENVIKVKMTMTEQGKSPETIVDAAVDNALSPEIKGKVESIKKQSTLLWQEVCQGSEENQSQYKDLILANKTLFSSQASSENPASDKKTSSGL